MAIALGCFLNLNLQQAIFALHDLDLFGWDVKHSAYSNPYNNSYFPLCYYNNIEPLGSSLSQLIQKGYPVSQ
jgi:hypothetical protein